MPQVAWEALLRDAVQGPCPPYDPQALRRWLQATHPQAWAISAPPPSPPPPHREGEGHLQGGGRRQQGTLRQGATEGKALIGTVHGKRHNVGAGNHQRTRKGQERGPRHRGRGHHGRRRNPHPGKANHDGGTSAAPPLANVVRLPRTHTPNAHRRSKNLTPHQSPAHTHQAPETTRGMEGTPTRGERATPTEEAAGSTAARHTTTPSPPGDDPGRHNSHLTGTRRRQRHGHRNQG